MSIWVRIKRRVLGGAGEVRDNGNGRNGFSRSIRIRGRELEHSPLALLRSHDLLLSTILLRMIERCSEADRTWGTERTRTHITARLAQLACQQLTLHSHVVQVVRSPMCVVVVMRRGLYHRIDVCRRPIDADIRTRAALPSPRTPFPFPRRTRRTGMRPIIWDILIIIPLINLWIWLRRSFLLLVDVSSNMRASPTRLRNIAHERQ